MDVWIHLVNRMFRFILANNWRDCWRARKWSTFDGTMHACMVICVSNELWLNMGVELLDRSLARSFARSAVCVLNRSVDNDREWETLARARRPSCSMQNTSESNREALGRRESEDANQLAVCNDGTHTPPNMKHVVDDELPPFRWMSF